MKYPRTTRSAVRALQRGHKLKAKQLHPYTNKRGDSFMLLLKRDGRTQKWETLGRINYYGVGYDSYRNKQTFEVATLDENFGVNEDLTFRQAFGIATHVALLPQNEFYSIKDGDESALMYLNFMHTFWGNKTSDKFSDTELEDLLV